MDYEVEGSVWTQSFRTERMDDQELISVLRHVGLQLQDVLTEDGAWVRAVAAADRSTSCCQRAG